MDGRGEVGEGRGGRGGFGPNAHFPIGADHVLGSGVGGESRDLVLGGEGRSGGGGGECGDIEGK